MPAAHWIMLTEASDKYLGQILKPQKDGSKLRNCSTCGRVDLIRRDNKSTRCQPCAASSNAKQQDSSKRRRPVTCCCENCKIEFITSQTTRRRWCSAQCRSLQLYENRTCLHCDESFRVRHSAIAAGTNASGNFCSRACYEVYLCKPDRVNGRGSQWHRVRNEEIKKFPLCAWCGTRRRLQVHHIVPFRLTRDNSGNNLIPLCVKCHKRIEWITVHLEMAQFDAQRLHHILSSYLRHRQRHTIYVVSKLLRESKARALAH